MLRCVNCIIKRIYGYGYGYGGSSHMNAHVPCCDVSTVLLNEYMDMDMDMEEAVT